MSRLWLTRRRVLAALLGAPLLARVAPAAGADLAAMRAAAAFAMHFP
ncbi:MAG: hypothetical protein Q7J32_12685 [Sphingomonadaceae bacterium]|nr:hypothetical protein [Sphingomonadaceae bacterium]